MIALLLGLPAAASPADWVADAATLTLSPELVSVEALVVRAGPGTLRIQRGVGRALVSGAAPGGAPPQVVGVVVAGSGQAHLAVPPGGAALSLANRVVGWMGGDGARGDALVAGQGMSVGVLRAVVLSPSVAAHLGDPVDLDDPDAARADLADLWEQRRALALAELEPGRAVGWDRYRAEVLGLDLGGGRQWWDARTDQPWGALEPDRARSQPVPGDRWLAVVDDPDRSLDGITRALAYTAGVDTLGRAARLPLLTWAGAGTPAVTPARAEATLTATPAPTGLRAEVRATIALQAEAPWPVALLRVPADATDLTVALADGTPLPALPLGETGRSRWLGVAPPGGLGPDPTPLVVGWSADWPAHGQPATTGPRRFLPGLVPDRLGSPADFVLTVNAPDGWSAAATGRTTGDRHVGAGAWPRAALVEGPTETVGPLRLLGVGDPSRLSERAQTLLAALHRITGAPPPDELDLVALPAGLRVGETSGGMVALQARLLDDLADRRASDRAQAVLAHELAHLTWGHRTRPASVADRWLAEVLAEVTAELALDDLAGGGTLPGRVARHLRVARALPPVPLPSAWGGADARGHLYHHGPAVLLGPLRRRIGDGALRAGLACAAARTTLSGDQLRACLEEASGQDLGDFWAFWVEGGQVPVVSGTWTEARVGGDQRAVTVRLSADVPYGTFTVPVGLLDRRGRVRTEAAVPLTDGAGNVTLGPLDVGRFTVVLDPHGEALVRGGAMSRARAE